MITITEIKAILDKYPNAYGFDYDIQNFGKKRLYVYFEEGNDIYGHIDIFTKEFRKVGDLE